MVDCYVTYMNKFFCTFYSNTEKQKCKSKHIVLNKIEIYGNEHSSAIHWFSNLRNTFRKNSIYEIFIGLEVFVAN